MDNQNDYRKWPNVLALDAEIEQVSAKLEQATSQTERMFLRQKWAELVTKRYDQIQFNKEMFRKETA